MIQILALRPKPSNPAKEKVEVWFERGIRAPSVEAIFASPLEHLQGKVPESERWNVYYTVAECLEESGRKLSIQHHIPFDVDGIDVPPGGVEESLSGLAALVCKAIGVSPAKTGILFSGNGLQFLVGVNRPIESDDYFDQARHHYKAVCDRIDEHLNEARIQGKADRSVWSPARLMRYPNTRNVKPNKPERTGFILNANIERVDFTLEGASGIPLVPVSDQIHPSTLKGFPTPDVRAIMDECQFMKWAQTSPADVSEPQWYAALSIAARFPDGRKHCHNLSHGHPSYSYSETESKIDQALQASGPRTCKSLDAVASKCKGCKHYQTKLVSPILIEGPDHIKTLATGFHFYSVDANGNPKKGRPDVSGLRKFFMQQHRYKVIEKTGGTVYVWKGTHYEEMSLEWIKCFAESNFKPEPDEKLRNEFVSSIRANKDALAPMDFFTDSIHGKINFRNGVLDIRTRQLTPHDPELGFRSVLPCDYDPGAQAPTWHNFVDQVTQKRLGLKLILQEFLGYAFENTGCYLEKGLLLVGEGANGKSTFVEVVRKLAGNDAVSNLSFRDMASEQHRVMLDGKLINISEENGLSAFKDTEIIKNAFSGGPLTAKYVYRPTYTFRNQAKFIMLCNEMPNLSDHSHGFYRKLLIVPFDATFSERDGTRDVHLGKKLAMELSGIFNWVMEGMDRLKVQGKFTAEAASEEFMEAYRQDADDIHAWFTESCALDSNGAFTDRVELYMDYQMWCQKNGVRYTQNRAKVLKYIRTRIKKDLLLEPKEKQLVSGHRALSNVKLLTAPKH